MSSSVQLLFNVYLNMRTVDRELKLIWVKNIYNIDCNFYLNKQISSVILTSHSEREYN